MSEQIEVEYLRGRLLAFEGVVGLMLDDYLRRNPDVAASFTPIMQGLAADRRGAEMLSDDALAGFREGLQDIVSRLPPR